MGVLLGKRGIDKETVLKITHAEFIFEAKFAIDERPDPAQDYYYATLDLGREQVLLFGHLYGSVLALARILLLHPFFGR